MAETKEEKKTQLSFRLDANLHRRFNSKAALHGREARDILTAAVKLYLIDQLREELVAEPPGADIQARDLIIDAKYQAAAQNTAISFFAAEEAQAIFAKTISQVLKETLFTVPEATRAPNYPPVSDTVSLSGGGTERSAAGDTVALWHAELDRIFASGHRRVIHAITHNLMAFGEMVDLISQGRSDDHNPEPTQNHSRETNPGHHTEKKPRKIA